MSHHTQPGFLSGSSKMSMLMRAQDWAASELGSPMVWPESLRALVGVMLDAPQPMFVAWGPKRIMLYNDAYRPFLDRGQPETLGRPIFELRPDLRPAVELIMDRTFAGESIELDDGKIILHPDGTSEVAHFTSSYTPVRDDTGAIAGLLCVCTDIAGHAFRLMLEERLRSLADPQDIMAAAAELLASHLSADRAGYAEVDADGDGCLVERDWHAPGTSSLAGRHTLNGQPLVSALRAAHIVRLDDARADPFTAQSDALPFLAPDARAAIVVPLVKNGHFGAAFFVHHNEPRRWSKASELLVREVAERTRTAVERARAESALLAANAALEQRLAANATEREAFIAELRQSQRMEAVGQLTGGLAHDFNNLLTVISVSLEILEAHAEEGHFGQGMERYISAALGATGRAAALTHRLLAFSRRQTLAPKPVNADMLIGAMRDLVQHTAGPRVALEVTGTPGLWLAWADPGQLEDVVLNLCINARDAMPHGGRLTIATSNAWVDEYRGQELDMAAGEYVSLRVTDTGTGMSPDVVSHVFEPFFTTKPTGAGTGLGLSMIYGFAKQSGGQVHVRSVAGEGTSMCLYLPRHQEKAQRPRFGAPSTSPLQDGQGKTFLVVEDEPTVRMLVVTVLDGMGYATLEAGNGAAGLKTVLSDARIDLLITDVGMPGGMNGRQLADAARIVRPGLKVLFITGYADQAAIGAGQLEPGMHVLAKPFATKVLAERIEAILAER